MSKESENQTSKKAKEVKGKLSWVVPVLDFMAFVGYFALGYGAIFKLFTTFDFVAFANNISAAVYFFVACTILVVVMCFIPVFKSKNNMGLAVCNIVWLCINFIGLLN